MVGHDRTAVFWWQELVEMAVPARKEGLEAEWGGGESPQSIPSDDPLGLLDPRLPKQCH